VVLLRSAGLKLQTIWMEDTTEGSAKYSFRV